MHKTMSSDIHVKHNAIPKAQALGNGGALVKGDSARSRISLGPSKIERLDPGRFKSGSDLARRVAQLVTDAMVLEDPGWLHSFDHTRAYVDALLEAALDARHGAIFVDVQRTLQGEVLRGACILMHSMEQARTHSPFKQIFEALDGGDAAKTEIWLDSKRGVDPGLAEVIPCIEFVAVLSRHGGQRIGQKLIRAAEEYCAISHCMADEPDGRPWSDKYAAGIQRSGFAAGDLVVYLNAVWPAHTPYYERQGYTAFHQYLNHVDHVNADGQCEKGDMLVADFFKRISV